ncbi:hypothetical protein ACSTKD_00235, partial [Vibrio parahaemolyticus]
MIDSMPPSSQEKTLQQLRKGELFIEQVHSTDEGHKINVPEGLIHHWVGIAFLPGANLKDTLAFLLDADHFEEHFRPAVR